MADADLAAFREQAGSAGPAACEAIMALVAQVEQLRSANYGLRVEVKDLERRLAAADRNWEQACDHAGALRAAIDAAVGHLDENERQYQAIGFHNRLALAKAHYQLVHALHEQALRPAREPLGRGDADG
jgi:hypothetical protein